MLKESLSTVLLHVIGKLSIYESAGTPANYASGLHNPIMSESLHVLRSTSFRGLLVVVRHTNRTVSGINNIHHQYENICHELDTGLVSNSSLIKLHSIQNALAHTQDL